MNNFAVKCFCQVVCATSFSGLISVLFTKAVLMGRKYKTKKNALETHMLFYLRVTSPDGPVWFRWALHLQRFISNSRMFHLLFLNRNVCYKERKKLSEGQGRAGFCSSLLSLFPKNVRWLWMLERYSKLSGRGWAFVLVPAAKAGRRSFLRWCTRGSLYPTCWFCSSFPPHLKKKEMAQGPAARLFPRKGAAWRRGGDRSACRGATNPVPAPGGVLAEQRQGWGRPMSFPSFSCRKPAWEEKEEEALQQKHIWAAMPASVCTGEAGSSGKKRGKSAKEQFPTPLVEVNAWAGSESLAKRWRGGLLREDTELSYRDTELPGDEGCPRSDGTDQGLLQAVERPAGALPRPICLSKGLQESQSIRLATKTSGNGADWCPALARVLGLLAPRRLRGLSRRWGPMSWELKPMDEKGRADCGCLSGLHVALAHGWGAGLGLILPGSGILVCSWPGLGQVWLPRKALGDGAEQAPAPCPPSSSSPRRCPELGAGKEAGEGWGRWGHGDSGSYGSWGCWREPSFGPERGARVGPVRPFQQEWDVLWSGQALAVTANPQGLCRGTLTCEPWGHPSPASLSPSARPSPGESLEETFPGSLRGAGVTPCSCSSLRVGRGAVEHQFTAWLPWRGRPPSQGRMVRAAISAAPWNQKVGQGRGCRDRVEGGWQELPTAAGAEPVLCSARETCGMGRDDLPRPLWRCSAGMMLAPHCSLPACLHSACCAAVRTLTWTLAGWRTRTTVFCMVSCLRAALGFPQRGTQGLQLWNPDVGHLADVTSSPSEPSTASPC